MLLKYYEKETEFGKWDSFEYSGDPTDDDMIAVCLIKEIRNDYWVYDSDNCDEWKYEFVVDVEGRRVYVQITHEFYWTKWDDADSEYESDNWYLKNDFYYDLKKGFDWTAPKERDWLIVS